MIYGDNPNKINEREDALGLNTYTYMPSINSIMQSGNLYVYGLNNPVQYADASGEIAFLVVTGIAGAIIGAITGGIIATNNGTEWWKGALVGAGLGGLAGVTAGGMIAATTTGVATASFSNVLVSGANWATASSVALSTSSATIGRNFEKWFYEFNQISKQYQQIVMNGIGRIDAFKNGHIYELKNYNWEKYSTSQINNIAEKFLQQYNKYQSISEFLGEKVKGIVFYFSSKPPQEIIEKLTEAGAIVEWVSSIK